jgi:hypothetical protein
MRAMTLVDRWTTDCVDCGLDDRGIVVRFPPGHRDPSTLRVFLAVREPTHPSTRWIPRTVCSEVTWPGCDLNLYLHLQHFCRLLFYLPVTTVQICSEAPQVIIIIIIIIIVVVVLVLVVSLSNSAVLGCPGGCRRGVP